MSDEPKAPAGAPAHTAWTVSGAQTIADGRSRVDILVRGTYTGTVDHGNGSDRLRFSVWDDGQEVAFKIVDIPLGKGGTVTVRLGFEGRYLEVADGIGIVITAGSDVSGERMFELDPFFPERG